MFYILVPRVMIIAISPYSDLARHDWVVAVWFWQSGILKAALGGLGKTQVHPSPTERQSSPNWSWNPACHHNNFNLSPVPGLLTNNLPSLWPLIIWCHHLIFIVLLYNIIIFTNEVFNFSVQRIYDRLHGLKVYLKFILHSEH